MYDSFEPVIGLEIHAQLKTKSKIFSTDSTNFEGLDNEHTSTVSVGMPGALPVLNRGVIEFAVKAGLALNCKLNPVSIFARKNYFYPDLPKGYQISQYELPICGEGYFEFYLDNEKLRVNIERAHLEEDAGKSTHMGDCTLVNYNRSGVPLLEIVTAPDLRSPMAAAGFVRSVRQTLQYLGVCDGNLEEGSLRCDCNVSVRKKNTSKFGTKVEIKNLNSFRFIEKALEYEIERQTDALLSGEKIVQETRLYDPDKNRTFTMRTKEDAQDYRYFPDPDLPRIKLSDLLIDTIKKQMCELPLSRYERFMSQYGLTDYEAQSLIHEKGLADYFEEAAKTSGNSKMVAHWIMSDLLRELNDSKKRISESPIAPEKLGFLIKLVEEGKISAKIGKTVFEEMWKTGEDPLEFVLRKGLSQVSDEGAVEKYVDDVLKQSHSQISEYKSGKKKLFAYFVGQVMRVAKGQANPDVVNQILKKKLGD